MTDSTPVAIDGALVAFDPLLLKGLPGDTGAPGAAGAVGATTNLTMGTVGTVPNGQAASASLTGTPPNQILNLVLPAGPIGTTGLPISGATASNEGIVYDNSPSWAAGRVVRDGNKDGLFYFRNFNDASGSSAADPAGLTYTKMYGGWGAKTGHGNIDAHWASIAHYGPDEAGLFIGDVTAKSSGSGGNLWGGHFQLNAEVAANMRGLLLELNPEVDVSSKVTFGLWAQNTSASQNPVTALLRTSGAASRHIICYSDSAATAIIFDVDQSGNIRSAGSITPLANGTQDIGSNAERFRALFANNIVVNGADTANVAGGLSIASISAPPLTANSNGGTMYVQGGCLMYQGTGGDGTTPVMLALSGSVPSFTLQSGAGSGSSAAFAVAGGTDQAGSVTVTLGSSPAAGSQVAVNFGVALAATPRGIQISAGNAAAASAQLYHTSPSTAGFTIATANTPGGNFSFSYRVDL